MNDVQEILSKANAILQGHFRLNSGRHSEWYVNKDALIMTDTELKKLIDIIVHKFSSLGFCNFDIIAGPAMGGAILAKVLAMAFSKNSGIEIFSVYTEKDSDSMALKRGYEKAVIGKKIFVIEDIITTGSSVSKTIDAIRKANGNVVCVCCIADRSHGKVTAETLGVPQFVSLCEIDIETWEEKSCPFCAQGIPIDNNIGHGKK
ncbi:MAG: phosphoribosyltransferase family protein [Patescibacteria group bacterium]|nr:phosphoribosyltransferase family protein [Patescibacteria group bacterium]MDD4304749.1 phosphoribosyltransferase family protein [Patescibacteria group bacterium]MDD4695760.1 phosphoribosyltransferase family protein [Patescibacteria group bacterium]